jgi:hypothetical protein
LKATWYKIKSAPASASPVAINFPIPRAAAGNQRRFSFQRKQIHQFHKVFPQENFLQF